MSLINWTSFSLLSFLLSTKSADQAAAWETLDSASRKKAKQIYNDAGIKILVSAFGSTEIPTTSGIDANTCAEYMANWVLANDVDGIDIDYEDLSAMQLADGKAEEWLITFTSALRKQLPQGKYIITHARKLCYGIITVNLTY